MFAACFDKFLEDRIDIEGICLKNNKESGCLDNSKVFLWQSKNV